MKRNLIRACIGITILCLVPLACVFSSELNAESMPRCACDIKGLDHDISLKSYTQMPNSIQKLLTPNFIKWDEMHGQKFKGLLDAKDVDNLHEANNDVQIRRFISAGHRQQRWYLLYEYRGYGGQSYHVVIVDLSKSESKATLISHVVVPLGDACEFIQLFIDNVEFSGPKTNNGQFW